MTCAFVLTKLDVLNEIFKYFGKIQFKTMFYDSVHYVERVSCVLLHLSLFVQQTYVLFVLMET